MTVNVNVADLSTQERIELISECFGYIAPEQKIAAIIRSFNDAELLELSIAIDQELKEQEPEEDEVEDENEEEGEDEE